LGVPIMLDLLPQLALLRFALQLGDREQVDAPEPDGLVRVAYEPVPLAGVVDVIVAAAQRAAAEVVICGDALLREHFWPRQSKFKRVDKPQSAN
jgi:hypothetical protein